MEGYIFVDVVLVVFYGMEGVYMGYNNYMVLGQLYIVGLGCFEVYKNSYNFMGQIYGRQMICFSFFVVVIWI